MASRRNLLKAATMGLASPILAASALPHGTDADLIRLCAEYHRLDAALEATPDEGPWDALLDQRNAVQTTLESMTPTTESGLRAKAGVALAVYDENSPEDERQASAADRFAWATLPAVAGRAG
jgi:hypothetical protein